ncbi:unnamed protein product, partial [marine sediment metagenome]
SFLNRYEIILSHSIGRSAGRNDGALKAHYRFLLFIDDDADFTEDTFMEYVSRPLYKNPLSVICMESIVCSSRVLALSKDLFFRLKGFDETFNFAEDMDFGYRVLEAGYKISYIPIRLIIHKEHSRPSRFENALRSYVNAVRFLVRYKKIILYDRNIKENILVDSSMLNILKMCIDAPRRGLLLPCRILITVFGLLFYSLFDNNEFIALRWR